MTKAHLPRPLAVLAAALLLPLTAGCPGSDPTPADPAPVATVTVTLAALRVGPGETVQATAVLRDAAGNELTGRPVAWDSSNAGAATVGPATGLVAGVSAGLTTITATCEGKSAAAPLTVNRLSAGLQVTVIQPVAQRRFADEVQVAASVTSANQLASVSASAGPASTPLVFDFNGDGTFAQVLSVAAVPSGPVTVVVTATDVLGHSTDAVVPVLLDRPPVLTVAAPLAGTVARPTTRLQVTCTDDGGPCTALTAKVLTDTLPAPAGNDTVFASGTTAIDQVVDLAAFEGRPGTLVRVQALDSAGQASLVEHAIHVEPSARLVTRAEVNGPIWDVSTTRVLFLDRTPAVPALTLRAVAGATEEVLETGDALLGGSGALAPQGAIWQHPRTEAPLDHGLLLERRGGVTTTLEQLLVGGPVVDATWASYCARQAAAGPVACWRRDLAAGTTAELAGIAAMNGLVASGDAVFADASKDIVRWRAGAPTAITSDPEATLVNFSPQTDGINVAWLQRDTSSGLRFRLQVWDGATTTELTTAYSLLPSAADFALAGGWVAYTAEDLAAVPQVWRWGPGGKAQVTSTGAGGTIDAVGPDGTIVYRALGRRFLAAPGSQPVEVGTALGSVLSRDGTFFVLLGRSVLEIVP